jgi:hypothetical protein
MKYFTPERYLRLGNLNDRTAFLDAQDDWESAITAYRQHLSSIRRSLSRSLRDLIESVYLHDAAVVGMWGEDDSQFTITLLPESDPSRLVVLTDALVESPQINRSALPEQVHSEPVAWLYDELDVEPAGGNGSPKGKIFTHNILLSNGWELRLRARTVKVSRPVGLIPANAG